MVEQMNRHVQGMRPNVIRYFTSVAKQTEDCAMLTIGEPDFNTPEAVKDACKTALDLNETHYPVNVGAHSLRQAIGEFEKKFRGISYAPEEVIVTHGATEALYAAFFSILEPGDEVIIPIPAFGLYASIVAMARAKSVFLDTEGDNFQIDPKKLSALITPKTKAILLNSPNNPTGVILTQETLNGIHEVLADKQIFVLCDDVYNQIAYAPCPSFAAFQDMRDRLILIQSFSKPYAMTGWRMGYLMGDAPVIQQLALYHSNVVTSVSSISQRACIVALQCDVSDMVATYKQRRDYICSRLDEIGLPYVLPQGAFYVFPSVKAYTHDTNEFCLRMIQEGKVAAVPGSCFGGEGYIRLSYCYSLPEIEKAMDRLAAYLKKQTP